MGYNTFLSYSSTIDIHCSLPTYEETRQRFLNLRSNINDNMICASFFSYVLKNERKESETPNTSDLMLRQKLLTLKKL
jgi:hypothetical protein